MSGFETETMCRLACALIISVMPVIAHGADRLDWAFPVADIVQPPAKNDDQPKTLFGSSKSYTQKHIDDLKNPPDWFPEMHPPMPEVVAQGSATFACVSCHLPTGAGHDESAYLAGLPAEYIARQMANFKSGRRKGFGDMSAIAQALTDVEAQSAAAYFASLEMRPWVRVVETDTVPKTYVNSGHMRLVLPAGGMEPIGRRIVELPEAEAAAIARDPRSGFVAYVPKGSIAKGETLVTTGGGETAPCTSCHGPALNGTGTIPAIAGRHPGYIVRQLYFFQNNIRSGPTEALMRDVVQHLSDDGMLAIAAYLASLEP